MDGTDRRAPRSPHRTRAERGVRDDARGERREVRGERRPALPAQRTGFYELDEINTCLEQVLASSIADETEVVWLQRRTGRATSRQDDPGFFENPRLSVLVRVVEGGRMGWYRTDTADPCLLESGVRQALAIAKVQRKLKQRPILSTNGEEVRAARRLLDPEICHLKPKAARSRLQGLCDDDEEARLSWTETRLVIYNSHGMRRSGAASEATVQLVSGQGPGAGYAAASARQLADLDPEGLRDRARRARGQGSVGALPEGRVPVVLSPEATIQWLNVLNAFAFSGRSFLDGTSFLAQHRNVQVFDRQVNLRDDGTAPGLPFPFDFEGTRKQPLDLIVKGKPSTPALTQAQGAQAGLKPTAQAVGGSDAFFCNLFLLPGETGDDHLAAADGGLRVGWLEGTECFEPSQLKVRMVARGVRRIENSELGAPLPDFVWHESLLGALARLRTIGDQPVVLSMPTTPLGGISAPAVVLEESGDFRAVPPSSSPRRLS